MGNNNLKGKISYKGAVKELLGGVLSSFKTGEIFDGFKSMNSKIINRIKKVFAIKTDEVSIRETTPHLNTALYVYILVITTIQLITFLRIFSYSPEAGMWALIGIVLQVVVVFFISALIYMIISNKKIWNSVVVKILIVLSILWLLTSVPELLNSFKLLRQSNKSKAFFSIIEVLLSMYSQFMILNALTFVKGARKRKQNPEATEEVISKYTSIDKESNELIPLHEDEDNNAVDLFDNKELENEIEIPVVEEENTFKSKFCSNCGSEIIGDASFCSECGSKLK